MCFWVVMRTAFAAEPDDQSAWQKHFNEDPPFAKYPCGALLLDKPPLKSQGVELGKWEPRPKPSVFASVDLGPGCTWGRTYNVIKLERLLGNQRASRLEASEVSEIKIDGIKPSEGWRVDRFGSKVVSTPPFSMRPPDCEPETWVSVGQKVKQHFRDEWKRRAPHEFQKQEERRKVYLDLKRAGKAGSTLVVLPIQSESGDACKTCDAATKVMGPDEDNLAHRGSLSYMDSSTSPLSGGDSPSRTSSTESERNLVEGGTTSELLRNAKIKMSSGNFAAILVELCCERGSALAMQHRHAHWRSA